MTHNIMLNKEGQIRHDFLRLSGNLFYPIKSDNTVVHIHVCGLHVRYRIPIRFIERYRRQECFSPSLIVPCTPQFRDTSLGSPR